MTLPEARTWRTAPRGSVVTLRASVKRLLYHWLVHKTLKHEGMTSAAGQVEVQSRRQRQCRHTLRQGRKGRTLVKTAAPKGIPGCCPRCRRTSSCLESQRWKQATNTRTNTCSENHCPVLARHYHAHSHDRDNDIKQNATKWHLKDTVRVTPKR